MGKLRLLVLDVLKPHKPSIIFIASALSDLAGVEGTDITVLEVEKEVENVKITLKGEDMDIRAITEVIESNSATIHSIDKVSSGSIIVEEAHTPQD